MQRIRRDKRNVIMVFIWKRAELFYTFTFNEPKAAVFKAMGSAIAMEMGLTQIKDWLFQH